MSTPCPYAAQWPELFARLPSDTARESLSQALANARLKGWEPTWEAVEVLVDAVTGVIPGAHVVEALVAHAQHLTDPKAGAGSVTPEEQKAAPGTAATRPQQWL